MTVRAAVSSVLMGAQREFSGESEVMWPKVDFSPFDLFSLFRDMNWKVHVPRGSVPPADPRDILINLCPNLKPTPPIGYLSEVSTCKTSSRSMVGHLKADHSIPSSWKHVQPCRVFKIFELVGNISKSGDFVQKSRFLSCIVKSARHQAWIPFPQPQSSLWLFLLYF